MDERILGSLLNRRAAASGPGWGRPTGASRRRLPSSPRRPGLRVTIGRVPQTCSSRGAGRPGSEAGGAIDSGTRPPV